MRESPQDVEIFNIQDGLATDSINCPKRSILLAYRGSVSHNMYVPKNDSNSIDDIDLIGFVIGGPEHYMGLEEANTWITGSNRITGE